MCKWTSAWIESRYFTNVTTDSDLRGMSRRCSEILKSSITLPRSTILILVIRSSWTFLFVTKIFIKGLVNKIKIADMSSWKDWPTVSTNNSQQKIFLRTDCYKNAEGVIVLIVGDACQVRWMIWSCIHNFSWPRSPLLMLTLLKYLLHS